MHGGSLDRSASEEVGDGATSIRQSSDDGPTDDPGGEPRSAQWRSSYMKRMGMARGLVAVMAAVVLAGACTSTTSPGASGGANAKYTIGFSNPGGVGNGWREAMLCSAKVQAVKAGNVT